MSTQLSFPASPTSTPGILASRTVGGRSAREVDTIRGSRFVTQSHVAGARAVHPGAILIAATLAVALYLIGRRLSD